MQWNRVNISKDELKRKQEEYTREALEISKKAKYTEEVITPVIIPVPGPDEKNTETEETVANIPEPEPIEEEFTPTIEETEAPDEIVTTATDEIEDNNTEETSPEELFENVFITEEEVKEKLKEADFSSEETSEAVPDFEGYIKSHNNKANKPEDE